MRGGKGEGKKMSNPCHTQIAIRTSALEVQIDKECKELRDPVVCLENAKSLK